MKLGRNSSNKALDQLARVERELAEPFEVKFFRGFKFAAIAALRSLPEHTMQRSLEKARIDLDRTIRVELRF